MQHGDLTHLDIPADDTARARRFYAELFGWRFEDSGFGDYQTFTTPLGVEGMGGGVGKRGDTAPSQVRAYVHVDSIDATTARVKELGGSVAVEKEAVGPLGWYAAIIDTEGNEIGLWERAPGR